MTRSTTIAVAGLVLLGALALGCGSDRESVTPTTLPAIAVDNLAGGEQALPSLLGDKPLLVWFWAPW